ncbi:hypothetical protein K8O92_22735 [Nocardia asteroides]|nr:hypothetical protein K8O92_22735 [Nocardia asteroides]
MLGLDISSGKPSLDTGRLERDLHRRPGIRIAIGDPATGLAGFRQTFRDAQRARNLALVADPSRALTLWSTPTSTGLSKASSTSTKTNVVAGTRVRTAPVRRRSAR